MKVHSYKFIPNTYLSSWSDCEESAIKFFHEDIFYGLVLIQKRRSIPRSSALM